MNKFLIFDINVENDESIILQNKVKFYNQNFKADFRIIRILNSTKSNKLIIKVSKGAESSIFGLGISFAIELYKKQLLNIVATNNLINCNIRERVEELFFKKRIGSPKILQQAIYNYNNQFGTDFEIFEILKDEVPLCIIRVSIYNITDIFWVGYETERIEHQWRSEGKINYM